MGMFFSGPSVTCKVMLAEPELINLIHLVDPIIDKNKLIQLQFQFFNSPPGRSGLFKR